MESNPKLKVQLSYEEAARLSQVLTSLKKESQAVRKVIGDILNRIPEMFPVRPKDVFAKQETEFNDNERIAIYRAVISILSEPEYEQKFFNWGYNICKLLQCDLQFEKKFNLDGDIERPGDFKFNDEFEIINTGNEDLELGETKDSE